MITKDDWNAALDAWVSVERERLGGPPTPAEIVAYVQGELPEHEAARVQELLVYYPELTPLLKKKVRRHPAIIRLLPIAAALAATLFTLPWHTAETPFVIASKIELHAIQGRGGRDYVPPYELPADEDRYSIAAYLSEPPHDPAYRVEIIDTSNGNTIWRSPGVQPSRDGAIELEIPRSFLQRRVYRLDVYGIDHNGPHLRDTFHIRATS